MLRGETVTFEGEFYTTREAENIPRGAARGGAASHDRGAGERAANEAPGRAARGSVELLAGIRRQPRAGLRRYPRRDARGVREAREGSRDARTERHVANLSAGRYAGVGGTSSRCPARRPELRSSCSSSRRSESITSPPGRNRTRARAWSSSAKCCRRFADPRHSVNVTRIHVEAARIAPSRPRGRSDTEHARESIGQ